jgi:hypothetical protein
MAAIAKPDDGDESNDNKKRQLDARREIMSMAASRALTLPTHVISLLGKYSDELAAKELAAMQVNCFNIHPHGLFN